MSIEDRNGCTILNDPEGNVYIKKDPESNFSNYVHIFQELKAITAGTNMHIDLVQTDEFLMYKYKTNRAIGLRFQWEDGVGMSTIKFVLENYIALLEKEELHIEEHWVVYSQIKVADKVPDWLSNRSNAQMRQLLYDSQGMYYNDRFDGFVEAFERLAKNEFYLFTGNRR